MKTTVRFIRAILISILLFTLSGCTADTAKRLAFDAVQDMRDQACQENMGIQCGERQSYDQYQQQLKTSQFN